MLIPAQRWHDAIYKRHSRRQYNGKPLSKETVDQLTVFINELNQHLPGVRVTFINENPDEVFKGFVGSYGKIQGAPAYAAFIGQMSDPFVQEKIGYLGECFILESTALGLGSCWVGGFFRPGTVAKQTKVLPGEEVLAITPLGYARENYTLVEKAMSGMIHSKDRKTLQELCEGSVTSDFSEWIKVSLEAARRAPSAVNRQPWRFKVEDQGIKIKIDNESNIAKLSKRLDCGIAMLHLEVGALTCGIQGKWEYLETPDVAKFTADGPKELFTI